MTYDVSGLHLEQVQNNFDYRTFDFYYTVDGGTGYMQYWNHKDKRDDQKIGGPVGVEFWGNNASSETNYQSNDTLIKQTLTDWIKDTVTGSNLGFTMNSANSIGIDTTGWEAVGTPTIDPATGIRTFTRKVAVYTTDGSGSLQSTKVGDLTVKYTILGEMGTVTAPTP